MSGFGAPLASADRAATSRILRGSRAVRAGGIGGAEAGAESREPTVVLFTGAVQSASSTPAATGPFYCPPDQTLHVDTSFLEELARMGGAGDFAQAYVVGHEVGQPLQSDDVTACDTFGEAGLRRSE